MDQNAYQLLYAIGYINQQRPFDKEEPPAPTRLFQTWLTLKFKSWKIEIQRAIEQDTTQIGYTLTDQASS